MILQWGSKCLFIINKIQNPNLGRWKANRFVDPVFGSLVYQLPEGVTLAYDLHLVRLIARWKGIIEEIQFGGSNYSFMADLKASESDARFEFESEQENRIWIIDVEPSATIATTTKVQPDEPIEPKKGECLFHSNMWVKGTPLHFIIDSDSQKKLISAEVVKRLALPTIPHPQPHTIE